MCEECEEVVGDGGVGGEEGGEVTTMMNPLLTQLDLQRERERERSCSIAIPLILTET